MSLESEIASLRAAPGVDQKTLRKVEAVFISFRGRRETIGRGFGRRDRLAQARAVVTPNTPRAEAVRAIAGALNIHRSSAYRFWNEIQGEKNAHR